MAETPNPITQTRNPHEMDTLGHAKTHAIAAMSGLAISARVGSLQDFVRPTYSSAHAGCSTHARTRSAHGSWCMKFPGAPSNDLRARDLGAASMSIQAHEGSRRRGGGSGSGAGMDRRGEMDVSGGVAVGWWVGGGSRARKNPIAVDTSRLWFESLFTPRRLRHGVCGGAVASENGVVALG